MISNRLLNRVKLPYTTVQGSFAYRQSKAANFTTKIINNLSGQIDKQSISLSKAGKLIKRLLPKNLDVFVRKNKGSDSGAQLNRMLNSDNYFIQHSIDLKLDKNGQISILNIPTIAHEIRHLADSLFHPKFLGREQLIIKLGLDKDKYLNFYDKNIYVKEFFFGKKDKRYIIKKIKNQTTKVLRGLPTEDKVNLLQWMRYNLISELNAYRQGVKTAKKLNNKNIIIYEDELYDQTKDYMFEEKIKLFTNMAHEIIKKERRIHRAKLKKSHSALNEK